MATLQDLCKSIPQNIKREQTMRELNRRKALSYAQRLRALAQEEHVFDRCVQRRPNKGRYKNSFSREEVGSIGSIVVGVRTSKYSVVVCKRRKTE